MGKEKDKLDKMWRSLRTSSRFHSLISFLIFVAIAAIFWLIMTLNDSVTETFRVKLRIENVPDTVTFISDPPADLHVTIRDKGTNLLRSGVIKGPEIAVNFRDYADNGVFRLSRSDINSQLKTVFGNTAQISASSLDSLLVYYTTKKGKRVPIVVDVDASAASGYIISGKPRPEESGVLIYSRGNETDTITHVVTEHLVRRNLSESTSFPVGFLPIRNVKIVPASVKVSVPVQPLVRKETFATVEAINIPDGISLLLFPNRVPVSCFVPMNMFGDDQIPVKVYVDYAETTLEHSNKLPVRIRNYPQYVVNVELVTDSVEYTIVKH